MSANSQIQALLQKGLLPFLMQKFGVKTPLGLQQAPTSAPNPNPTLSPGRIGGSEAQTSAAPAYLMNMPPTHGPAPMSGAPIPQPHEQVNSLAQLVLGWEHRKHERKAAEMQNVWTDLMESLEAAQDPDSKQRQNAQQMVDIIMERHGKDLAKFFKGRFEEVQKQQEKSKKGKEPNPVEKGLEGALREKRSEAQSKTSPPQAGGYYLPMAGPQAQLGNIKMGAELSAARQDPARTLGSQLTSGETRQQQLAEAGLATTPKIDAELKKYALEVTKAQTEAEKAATELKTIQQRSLITGKRNEAEIEKARLANQTAQVKLDIERQKLQIERQKRQGLKTVSQSNQLKLSMIQKAEEALNSLVGSKKGIDKTNVANIVNLLQSAGAKGIAADLLKQQGNWWKSYSTPQELLTALQSYKKAFQEAFAKEKEGVTSVDEEPDEDTEDTPSEPKEGEPMEGDVVDGYRFKGGDPSNKANWEPVKKP